MDLRDWRLSDTFVFGLDFESNLEIPLKKGLCNKDLAFL